MRALPSQKIQLATYHNDIRHDVEFQLLVAKGWIGWVHRARECSPTRGMKGSETSNEEVRRKEDEIYK